MGLISWITDAIEDNRRQRQIRDAEEEERRKRYAKEQRQIKEERRKQTIWSKGNPRFFDYGGGYGGYETRTDSVRYVAGRFIAETSYDGDNWNQSELLPTREDAEKWIVAHQGADDLSSIKWPGDEK